MMRDQDHRRCNVGYLLEIWVASTSAQWWFSARDRRDTTLPVLNEYIYTTVGKRNIIFELFGTYRDFNLRYRSWEFRQFSPQRILRMIFLFPKVGIYYCSSMEGYINWILSYCSSYRDWTKFTKSSHNVFVPYRFCSLCQENPWKIVRNVEAPHLLVGKLSFH